MSEKFEDLVVAAVKTQEQGKELMEKLIAVAQPGAVYSEPITSGDYTLITASEVSVGMGFGQGLGGGSGTELAEGEEMSLDEAEGQMGEASGFGSGGGGGGFSMGRPVAAISIGPSGVQVEPVIDVTKLGLAFITAAGAMLMLLGKMRRL